MFSRPNFFGKLFLGHIGLMSILLAACAWLVLDAVENFCRSNLKNNMRVTALALQRQTLGLFNAEHAAELDRICKRIGGPDDADGTLLHLRITFVRADGKVLAESDDDPARLEPHGAREEIRAALSADDGWGESQRWSDSVRKPMLYVARRVGPRDAPVGVVRVAAPSQAIVAEIAATRYVIWAVLLAALMVAAIPALALARYWSRPVAAITDTARQIAVGDLSRRVEVAGSDELAQLGSAVNEMRDRLVNQIETIDRQRRNLQVLIAGLEEGVVVVDADGHVVHSNPKVRRMLGSTPATAGDGDAWAGRLMEVVIPNHELQTMLLAGAADRRVTERSVEVETADGRRTSFRARASDVPVERPDGTSALGRMLVLTDITELSENLRMKSDFVANASHELRTPLNTLTMALENLQGMDLSGERETADRFLAMAVGHCRRLEALVRDMLDLSRLEAPGARFEPEAVELPAFLDEVRAKFADKLAEKNLEFQVEGPPDAQAAVNPHLLSLVLDNLVENAVKFTAQGRITATVRPKGSRVEIAVADTGCGIPAAEQSRVFERFYQVDRARSGAIRGTGLGLSIVKHAVVAMEGQVKLESDLGKGTTITVSLPGAAAPPRRA